MRTDHEMLFAALAQRAGLITPGQLAEAQAARPPDDDRCLADHLVAHGWLDNGGRVAIEAEVRRVFGDMAEPADVEGTIIHGRTGSATAAPASGSATAAA